MHSNKHYYSDFLYCYVCPRILQVRADEIDKTAEVSLTTTCGPNYIEQLLSGPSVMQ